MDARERASAFLTAHGMHPDQMDFSALVADFMDEMDRGLRGVGSSVGMFPAYIHGSDRPRPDTPVLVLDAGGTNLRAARVRFTAEGRAVTEELRKSKMPGTRGAKTDVDEMFTVLAREAMAVCGGSELACISFSYPCEVLPNGDGRMLRLTKELHVRGLEGSLICEPLERKMQELGAPGKRRWRLINDTVGAMLGGMAENPKRDYADYIGLILGTGTNTCCNVAAERITKSPAAVAMGGDVIVNLESGGFGKVPMGDADLRMDAVSVKPGEQWTEKMISGGYYPPLLRETLLMAAEDGLLSAESAGRLKDAEIRSKDVDLLCLLEGGDLFEELLGAERPFAREVNELLLRRASVVTAAILTGIIRSRGIPAGETVCVCADGTTIEKNPRLRPVIEEILRREVTDKSGVAVEFFQVSDATLLGSAYAGLLD